MDRKISLFDAIRTMRAMRRLKPDPVPDELIREILEAATCAPPSASASIIAPVSVRGSISIAISTEGATKKPCLIDRIRSANCSSEPEMDSASTMHAARRAPCAIRLNPA